MAFEPYERQIEPLPRLRRVLVISSQQLYIRHPQLLPEQERQDTGQTLDDICRVTGFNRGMVAGWCNADSLPARNRMLPSCRLLTTGRHHAEATKLLDGQPLPSPDPDFRPDFIHLRETLCMKPRLPPTVDRFEQVFYRRRGDGWFGQLADLPPGKTRYRMSKQLGQPAFDAARGHWPAASHLDLLCRLVTPPHPPASTDASAVFRSVSREAPAGSG